MSGRSAQVLAAALAFFLILLVGATIFVLLSRPPAPRPSATPSAQSSAGPTASALPTAPPSPTSGPGLTPTPTLTLAPTPVFPTAAPTDTPTPTPEPTPTLAPTPTPTPAPTISPTSPQRQLTLTDFGLDRRSDPTAVQRTVSFVVDGPSLISAQLSNVSSGSVRMCLSRNALDPQRECRTAHNGGLLRVALDAGQSEWNVTLIGASDAASPFVTLTLRFNALSPTVRLDSFRFNGTIDPHYNGFAASVEAGAAGNVRVRASFDDGHGNPYQYHLVITRTVNSEVVADQSGGPQGNLDVSFALLGGELYRVELAEPEVQAGGGLFAVFVDATLTWP